MAKRKTHEEYVAELATKRPDVEVVGIYINAHTKITHRCIPHNVCWDITPHNILCGKRCPSCSKNSFREKRAKTHDEYVDELKIKNPTVEVVQQYIDALTCITHHCLIHDVYWDTTPARALQGVGCNLCHSERVSAAKFKSNDKYAIEVNNVSPHIVVVGEYIDARTPILHKCMIHDVEWSAYPDNILRGHGCCECGNDSARNKLRKTHEQYVEELALANKDIIVVETYINSLTSILHRCLLDGCEWNATPANVLLGNGCPRCNESNGERYVRQWLETNNIEFEFQKKFDDCKNIRQLPFDFYLPLYNTCIEYQGKQHYEPIEYFGGEETFETRVKCDKIKKEYCDKNNIRLLCIPYYANAEEELNNFLFI